MRRYFPIAALAAVLVLFLTGCSDDSSTQPDAETGRILLDRDLTGRVTSYPEGVDLPVDDDAASSAQQKSSLGKTSHRQVSFSEGALVLVLRAEVDPPALDGVSMRATHVQLVDNRAYVTYNREGETFLGGVEVFDLTDPSEPVLLSQALFTDTDVSAATIYDGSLYLASATEDETFTTPAMLEILALDASGLLTTDSERIDLPSYVATSVLVAEGSTSSSIFVTSGTGGSVPGGLSIFDAATLSLAQLIELDDARYVDLEGDRVVVMQGTPGRLKVYDATTYQLVNSYAPGGANIAESKSTIDVVGDRIYMAAGDEGVKVVGLSTGEVLNEVEAVTLEGIDPSLTVTNAVTVDGELLLMGNAEAGTYLSQIDGDSLYSIGYINFGTSSNYVVAKDHLIFISSGAGGFKVVEAVYYNPAQGSFLAECSGWDNKGVPDCIQGPCTELATVQDRIDSRFPDRRSFVEDEPQYFETSIEKRLLLTDTTSLRICFAGDKTGWTNTLGYYTYPVDTPPSSVDDLTDMTVLFPNVSSTRGGGGLLEGNYLEIGPFDAGTVVGFFLVAQGWHAGTVTAGRDIHYTDLELNMDGSQQHVLIHDETTDALVLSWEDALRTSPRQQTDFNDVQLLLSASNSSAIDYTELPKL